MKLKTIAILLLSVSVIACSRAPAPGWDGPGDQRPSYGSYEKCKRQYERCERGSNGSFMPFMLGYMLGSNGQRTPYYKNSKGFVSKVPSSSNYFKSSSYSSSSYSSSSKGGFGSTASGRSSFGG